MSSYNRNARIPKIDSRWVWEIDKAHARELIEVIEVKWNGEEWWVCTRSLGARTMLIAWMTGGNHWNDLSRFAEAVTPVGRGGWRNPPQVKEGEELRLPNLDSDPAEQ